MNHPTSKKISEKVSKFLKENKICTYCMRRKAEKDHFYCENCLERKKAYKLRTKHKDSLKYDKSHKIERQQHRKSNKLAKQMKIIETNRLVEKTLNRRRKHGK